MSVHEHPFGLEIYTGQASRTWSALLPQRAAVDAGRRAQITEAPELAEGLEFCY